MGVVAAVAATVAAVGAGVAALCSSSGSSHGRKAECKEDSESKKIQDYNRKKNEHITKRDSLERERDTYSDARVNLDLKTNKLKRLQEEKRVLENKIKWHGANIKKLKEEQEQIQTLGQRDDIFNAWCKKTKDEMEQIEIPNFPWLTQKYAGPFKETTLEKMQETRNALARNMKVKEAEKLANNTTLQENKQSVETLNTILQELDKLLAQHRSQATA